MAFPLRLPRPLLLAAFWTSALAVGVLSLLPPALPLPTTGWDKSNHMLAFLVLGLLGLSCWRTRAAAVLLGLAGYGAAIELAQSLSGIRIGDWVDLAADLAGLALAALAWKRLAPAA